MKTATQLPGIIALAAIIGLGLACTQPAEEKEDFSDLTGTVSITGTAQVGQTLTADIDNLGGSGDINYQWKCGTANIGTNSNTYLVIDEDEGYTITVTVTRSGNSGNVTSNPTATVASDRINVGNAAEWNAALATIKDGGNGTPGSPKPYTITVTGDVMVTGSTSNSFGSVSNVTVTLNGNGKLYIIGQGSLLNIGGNQTVYINSAGLTLEGLKSGQNDSSFNNNRAVVYMTGGTLELRNGNISGNNNSGMGGGVYTSGNSNFIMSGGTISGNTCGSGSSNSAGGGVYSFGNSNFTMSGGTISDNTSKTDYTGSASGGGVYASNFTMTGGTISGNTARPIYGSASGGGVYAINFTMSGGTIKDNTARCAGSGVMLGDQHPELAGGGGVYVTGTGFMSGGIISGNTAVAYDSNAGTTMAGLLSPLARGGGVRVSGSFTKSGGGIIYGNNVANTSDRNTASTEAHAMYYYGFWVGTTFVTRSRNATLGEADDISTNTQTGWGQ